MLLARKRAVRWRGPLLHASPAGKWCHYTVYCSARACRFIELFANDRLHGPVDILCPLDDTMIMIAFVGAIRDFFTIFSLRREPSPTHTLKPPGRNRVKITCNTSITYHVQHVVLRATWYEGTAVVLSLTKLKSHLFELYFIS